MFFDREDKKESGFVSSAINAVEKTAGTIQDITKGWADTQEGFAAAFDRRAKIENSVTGRIKDDIMTEESDRIFEETGVRLELRQPEDELIDKTPGLFGFQKDQIKQRKEDTRLENETKIAKLRENSPNFTMKTDDEVSAEVLTRAKEIDERATRASQESGIAGMIGPVAGDAVGSFTDPVNLGLVVATGPIAGIGRVALASVMMREGILNAGIEATQQFGFVQDRREDLGLEFGNERAKSAIVAAGIGGAAFGGAAHVLFKGGKALVNSYKNQVSEFFTKVKNPTKRQKAAATDMERTIHVESTNPVDNGILSRGDHVTRMEKVFDAIENDVDMPHLDPVPLAKGRKTVFADLEEMDISTLEVDAKKFQFRDSADAQGVQKGKGSLNEVSEWNPELAGTVHVFETKAGKRIIADGHQRRALAARIKSQDPKADTTAFVKVFKEEDGFTPESIKFKALGINLAQGSANRNDVLRTLKIKDADLPALPPVSTLSKNVSNMSKLSDDAFLVTSNNVVDPRFASLVGELEPNPKLHLAMLDMMEKAQPKTIKAAKDIITTAQKTGSAARANENLFSSKILAKALFRQRMRVLNETIGEIRKNTQLANEIINYDKKVTKAGDDVVDLDSNTQIVSGSNKILEVLNRLSNKEGKFSDALTEAARQAKETGDFAGAATKFADDVNRSVHEGLLRRESVGRPGSPSDVVTTSSKSSTERGVELQNFPKKFDEARASVDTESNTVIIGDKELDLNEKIVIGAGIDESVAERSVGDLLNDSQRRTDLIKAVGDNGTDEKKLAKLGFEPEEIRRAKNLEDRIKKDLLQEGSGDSEASSTARERVVQALKNEKEDVETKTFQTINVQKRIEADFERFDGLYGKDPRDLAEKLFSTVEHDGFSPFPSWKNRFDNIKGQAHSMFVENLHKFETKAAGLYNPATGNVGGVARVKKKTGLDEIVHEMFGSDSKSDAARELSSEYQKTLDFLHRKAIESGVDMPKLSDYRLPNPSHSPTTLFEVGKAEWTRDIDNYLDWDKMKRPKTGTVIPREEREEVLSAVFDTLVTDGKNKVKIGRKTLLDHLKDSRFLKFKDAPSYMEYSKKYTDGNVFETMVDHIDKMSRRIALAETFGPDPVATKNALKQGALKAAAQEDIKRAGTGQKPVSKGLQAKMNRFDAMFDRAADIGDMNEGWISNSVGATKNLMTSAFLPNAVLSAISDFPKAALAQRGMPIPSARFMKLYLGQLNPLDGSDRRLATRAELVNEVVNLETNSAARWFGEVHGPQITRRIADTSMRLNLLSPHTQAAKKAFSLEFMAKFADDQKKSFTELDNFTQNIFLRNNITDKDWDVLRKTDTNFLKEEDIGEGRFIGVGDGFVFPADLRKSKHVDEKTANDVADKFMHLINNQKNLGIVDESIRTSTLWLGTASRNSLPGALGSAVGFLKTFPVTVTRQTVRQTQATKGITNKLKFLGALGGSMGVAGGVSLQMQNIASGRDPESALTGDFWARAVAKGGFLGVYEQMFQGINEYGKGVGKEIAGPHFTLATDITNLTIGNAIQAFEKKKSTQAIKKIGVSNVNEKELEDALREEFPDSEIRITSVGKKTKKAAVIIPGVSQKDMKEAIARRFPNSVARTEKLTGDDLDAFKDRKVTVGGAPGEIVETDVDTNFLREAAKFAIKYSPSASGPYSSLIVSRLISDELLRMADKDNTESNWYKDSRDRFKEKGQSYWWGRGDKKPLRSPDFGAITRSPEETQKLKGFEFKSRGAPKKKKRNRTGGAKK